MTYKTFTWKQDVVAIDIQTMANMSIDEYNEYLRFGLLTVDHHDILRSEPAGYPIATSKEQFNALLSYLNEIAPKVGS